MIVTSEDVSVRVNDSSMRVHVTAPRAAGRFPGVLLSSDIFQLTGPHLRAAQRLAGYGFVVASPEIFHRREPAGTATPFTDQGRTRALENARTTRVADYDADSRAALDYLAAHPNVGSGRLAAVGFCIGGHLAFRAALQPDVRASVCFYPTGVHDGALGVDPDAGTLARVRAKEIRGEMLLVFGLRDPHVAEPARQLIDESLRNAGTRYATKLYDAEHAFMRDEGPRYDPEATDDAWLQAIGFLRRVLD
jgi:carboxymethylenebutenolidase